MIKEIKGAARSRERFTAALGYLPRGAVAEIEEIARSVDGLAERTSENGTIEYITKNPMHFITNAACVEDGGDGVGDWLVAADNSLWNENSKSIYDPCPHG